MITYNYVDTPELDLDFTAISNWIEQVIQAENSALTLGEITYIFCNDATILSVNQTYLQHDYYTDIITFDYCEETIIAADIYISIDTVQSNALEFKTDFLQELHRVIIHGIFHLLGYQDLTPTDEKNMRNKENEALRLINLF